MKTIQICLSEKKYLWDIINWEKIIEIKKTQVKMKLNNSFSKAPFISVFEAPTYITNKIKYFDLLEMVLVEIIERDDYEIDLDQLIWEVKFRSEWLKIKFTWKNINFLNS